MDTHRDSASQLMDPLHRRGKVGLSLGLAFVIFSGSIAPATAVSVGEALPTATLDSVVKVENAVDGNAIQEIEVGWEVTTADQDQPETSNDFDSGPPGTPDKSALEPADETAEERAGRDSLSIDEPLQPKSIPNPGRNTAVINVKVGGDRAANGIVQPLAGVTLALHRAGTGTGGGGYGSGQEYVVPTQGTRGTAYDPTWSWTTCTSDAQGDCSFVIPIRTGTPSPTGVPQDTRFWIAQTGASPDGWYSNPNVRVGGNGATPERLWEYRFRTDTRLRAGELYSSTSAMPWNTTAADPDRYFMRNRVDRNSEDWFASNVGRTTGVWNQSRNNPEVFEGCTVDIALITDTSGSLRANNDLPKLKKSMNAFVDAFRGTNARMAVFSFSSLTPGNGNSNHPALLPVTTASQASVFKSQYAGWVDGGGTNWDAAFAEVANAEPDYDLAILLTDGNPTVLRNDPVAGSSAYNSIQDVDAGVFSANQLKAKGTRVLALGIGGAMTNASEHNLRAVSGPTKNVDYFRAGNFDEATQKLVELASESCSGTIGVQKLIVPEGGSIEDATPAPAGWEFGAALPNGGAEIQPESAVTAEGGEGKVDFGLAFDPGTTQTNVNIHEVQQDGFELVPVDGKNAVCENVNTGASVSVSNTGDDAKPAFEVSAKQNERIECKMYNRQLPAGEAQVVKTSDPESGTEVVPGQEVEYTLTFSNPGTRTAEVAYDDVLAGVLDDADLVSGPVAQAPLNATYDSVNNRIKITGSLPADSTKTVTYTVKVKEEVPATSDGMLGNFVVKTGEQPPSECEPEDPLCTEHPVKGSLAWNKVDGSDASILLSGSTWTLTPYDANGELLLAQQIVVEDCVADSASMCSGPDQDPAAGKFRINGLTLGEYSLEETEAPAGFKLLTDPIDVLVNSNYSLGDIENFQMDVPGLPLTGGMGTQAFLFGAGGIALLLAIAFGLQRRQVKSEVI